MSSIEGYKELLRVIYEKPVNTKPELGTRPKWLDEPTLDTKLNMFVELFDDDVTPGSDDDPTPLPDDDDERFKGIFKFFEK